MHASLSNVYPHPAHPILLRQLEQLSSHRLPQRAASMTAVQPSPSEPPKQIVAIVVLHEQSSVRDIEHFTTAACSVGATELVIDIWSREAEGLVELRYYKPAH